MNFKIWLSFNVWAITTVCISPSFASIEAYQSKEDGNMSIKAEQPAHGENPRFVPYETNSAVYQRTQSDENSIDANFSFRYYIYRPGNDTREDRLGAFLSYTGEFDFYAYTRDSSPVVNRYNNPAFHYRFLFSNLMPKCSGMFCPRWVDLAIEHISNGQTLDAKSNQAMLQDAYNKGEHVIFDSISRAGAQIALTGEVKYPNNHGNQFTINEVSITNEVYLKGLIRFDQDAGVYWGPYANSGVDYNDFQAVIVTWRSVYGSKRSNSDTPKYIQFAWSVGAMGFATDSMNVILSIPYTFSDDHKLFWQDDWIMPNGTTIPFALTAHFGPMNTLSNYTQTQRSIGVGLSFDY